MIGRVWERLARPWRDAAAIIAEAQAIIAEDKPPVPGTGVNPRAPQPPDQWLPPPAPGQPPARESTNPAPPAPALPRRPPAVCGDCGAPLSYTIRVWDCDQVRLYGPHGQPAGRTRCLDGELRRLFHDMAGDPDGV